MYTHKEVTVLSVCACFLPLVLYRTPKNIKQHTVGLQIIREEGIKNNLWAYQGKGWRMAN